MSGDDTHAVLFADAEGIIRHWSRGAERLFGYAAADAIGRSLEGLAGMMKSSITELQGMMGGEMGTSMQQLRQSAAAGEGQMRATMDLAKEMGSGIARQQDMRKARGAMLFQEYKKKMGMVQPEAAAAATPPAATPQPERQKIPEK